MAAPFYDVRYRDLCCLAKKLKSSFEFLVGFQENSSLNKSPLTFRLLLEKHRTNDVVNRRNDLSARLPRKACMSSKALPKVIPGNGHSGDRVRTCFDQILPSTHTLNTINHSFQPYASCAGRRSHNFKCPPREDRFDVPYLLGVFECQHHYPKVIFIARASQGPTA